MAVTKIWAIHDSVSRVVDYCTNPSKTKLSDLEQVLLYAADKEKTLDEGEQQYAVTGIGCRAESAAREMAACLLYTSTGWSECKSHLLYPLFLPPLCCYPAVTLYGHINKMCQ